MHLLSSGEPRALAIMDSLLGVFEERHGDMAPRILSGVGTGMVRLKEWNEEYGEWKKQQRHNYSIFYLALFLTHLFELQFVQEQRRFKASARQYTKPNLDGSVAAKFAKYFNLDLILII